VTQNLICVLPASTAPHPTVPTAPQAKLFNGLIGTNKQSATSRPLVHTSRLSTPGFSFPLVGSADDQLFREKCFSTFGRKQRASGRNMLARLFGAHARCIPRSVGPSWRFSSTC
jgi:hypothetical protein